MYLAGRWADRQLSRMEIAFVIIILGLLIASFLQYMLKIFAYAERSLLTTSVININTTLQYRAAAYVLRGDFTAIEAMQGMNPFSMSAESPVLTLPEDKVDVPLEKLAEIASLQIPYNYLGELDRPEPGKIGGGSWYFDLESRTLVYQINNDEYFVSNLPPPYQVSFAVNLDYEDLNNNNRFDPRVDQYKGIKLEAINEYEWQLE